MKRWEEQDGIVNSKTPLCVGKGILCSSPAFGGQKLKGYRLKVSSSGSHLVTSVWFFCGGFSSCKFSRKWFPPTWDFKDGRVVIFVGCGKGIWRKTLQKHLWALRESVKGDLVPFVNLFRSGTSGEIDHQGLLCRKEARFWGIVYAVSEPGHQREQIQGSLSQGLLVLMGGWIWRICVCYI